MQIQVNLFVNTNKYNVDKDKCKIPPPPPSPPPLYSILDNITLCSVACACSQCNHTTQHNTIGAVKGLRLDVIIVMNGTIELVLGFLKIRVLIWKATNARPACAEKGRNHHF